MASVKIVRVPSLDEVKNLMIMDGKEELKKFQWAYRFLRKLYLIMGGFYYSKEISKVTKCIWLGYILFFVLMSLYGLIYYVFTTDLNKMDINDVLLISVITMCTCYILVITPIITFFLIDDIDLVLSHFEDCRKMQMKILRKNLKLRTTKLIASNHRDNEDVLIKKINPSITAWIFKAFIIGCQFYALLPPAGFALASKEYDDLQVKDFPFVIPFYDRAKSFATYWAIIIFQFVIVQPYIVIGVSQVMFVLLTSIMINNVVVDQFEMMRHFSRLLITRNEHVMMVRNAHRGALIMAKFFDDFENHFILLIQQYNRFWK